VPLSAWCMVSCGLGTTATQRPVVISCGPGTTAASKVADATSTTSFDHPGWAIASPAPRRPLAALAALSALTEDYPDTGYVVNLPV
jgi:hypothetical protein